ncbi:MAG: CBS domain-containing protein [bacterium]|nr:CBS domain-containing protein [bacterium]
MIEEGRIEAGVRRIGAEQEVFLVDRAMRPAPAALEILERLAHPAFTTELGMFNLEMNLQPRTLEGDGLRSMEHELEDLLCKLRAAARVSDHRVVLTGILPTLTQDDLSLDWLTPRPRYLELNRSTVEHRRGAFRMQIKGTDRLDVKHDNVMFEACNTSFQVHFQVAAAEFAPLYNLAQAITGPVLAASVNSPVLLQRRLWHETRMALFQQSVDSRSREQKSRQARPRVGFGDRWVERSVIEVYRDDIARFHVFIAGDLGESPLSLLERGETPRLSALCVHNGSVYRWNRPCYGVMHGVPHLRIEHRVLPSGPTVADEMANAALFYGLMIALSEEIDDVGQVMPFDDVKTNFHAAARYGLGARFRWMNRSVDAGTLILEQLLPHARRGLAERQVDAADVDRYLDIVEERVRSGRTGSQWVLDSLAEMSESRHSEERHRVLTASMYERSLEGSPVHTWPLAELPPAADWRDGCRRVDQLMTTDLFTVRPDDLIDLAASLMDWEHIRHVPVEDKTGRLVGLVSHRQLLRMVGRGLRGTAKSESVSAIMTPDPITVGPKTSTLDAVALMRKHKVGCLPVTDREHRLIGIVTERDFIEMTAHLLDEKLRDL